MKPASLLAIQGFQLKEKEDSVHRKRQVLLSRNYAMLSWTDFALLWLRSSEKKRFIGIMYVIMVAFVGTFDCGT